MNTNKNLIIQETFSLAIKNDQENKTDTAQELYNQVLKIDPNNLAALNNLGTIYIKLGEHQKAKNCYEKAIRIDPTYADAYSNLGVVFKKLGEIEKAINCYKKAIELNPNFVNGHNNLGAIFKKIGEIEKAKDCYEKVLQIDPNNIHSLNALWTLLGLYNFKYNSKADKENFKKLILFFFKKKNSNPENLFRNATLVLLSDDETNNLLKIMNSESLLLKNETVQNLIKEELLYLILQKSLFKDIFWEKLLNKLRSEILFNLENSSMDFLNKLLFFTISLAEQCWLNEYVYTSSEKEINLLNKLKDKIEKNKEINELEIAILGCYIPLNASKILIEKLLNYTSTNILFNDLIILQIKEPLNEKKLSKSIRSLGEIVDPMSRKIQDQYEENPYPRWRYTNNYLTKNFFLSLNEEIEPNLISYNKKFDNPNVLVAGSGTGAHTMSTFRYENSNILAIDLSLSSLAFNKRKTEEFGHNNIKYMQADILQLKKLNRKFDIIECGGTLHHMKDPIAGLKVLLDILEPHGFLKLALYSEQARKPIIRARELIKMKNLKSTNEDIKNFRQDIIREKTDPLIQKIIFNGDFYYTSGVRDLLFNIQEHRFTIPQIFQILKDLNLEFLGFNFNNNNTKEEYKKKFPKDKKCNTLDNWHEFEKKNPTTFDGMYQFWVRKL